jgi:LL-diaminopimelate aminotransferase
MPGDKFYKLLGGVMPGFSDRVRSLPPYPFVIIEQKKREAVEKGIDLIDLSIGDPDIPTFPHIVEAMKLAVEKPDNHRYPSSAGMSSFREAVASWYRRRFSVSMNSASEVVSAIGSKEAVGHLPLAFVNPGDVVLVPTPGYPVYAIGTMFAGGENHFMPLLEQNNFMPDLKAVPDSVLKRTKLMWLNYPNNPTAALGTRELFVEAIALARKYGFAIAHDAAYSELYFDGNRPMSFLEVEGARDVGIEIHSLSKTYSMTGWRIGFAVGNSDIIGGLAKVKSNLDSGAFQAVQEASLAAFATPESELEALRNTYQSRRDALYEGLKGAGFSLQKPGATFYLWMKVPKGQTSAGYAQVLLEQAGLLVTPGSGFGEPGEGYVRFALTVGVERIKEAVARIRKIA